MGLPEICDLIKAGKVKKAFQLCQPLVNTSSDLYLVLLKLNSVCYKNIPELSTPHAAQDVVSLADFLCRMYSSSGGDLLKIVQPLYHITNYVLKFDPLQARGLSKYFFEAEALTSRRKSAQTKEEQAVYSNLLHIFSNKFLDRFNRLDLTLGEDSVESWLEFIYRLNKLRNNDYLYKVFQVLHTILVKRPDNSLYDYVKLSLLMVKKWLTELSESNVTKSTDIVESFAGLVQVVLALVVDVKDLMCHVKPMVDCTTKILTWCPESHGAMAILQSALLLCQTLENQNGPAAKTYVNRLVANVAKLPPKMPSVLPVVHTLLYKSRRSLITADMIHSDIFSLLLSMSDHTDQSNEPDVKKSKKILEIVYIAFTILNGATPTKETLEEKFNDVKKFVRLLCKTAASTDYKSSHFSAGVAELLNVMNAYKRAELTVQSAQMCQYMFRVFSKLDPDFISDDPYFRNYIEVWLKSWVTSCAKNTHGIDTQVMLIIFAQRHPKFTIETMKAWTTLKKVKAIEVKMHATVLDVLSINKQEIERNNPDLKVADFDIGRLLLGEAYAYSKTRDLYGEPVLNIYKAAAKSTKKNYIALANILCCTVDAFTFDVNDKSHFASLDASVMNMIGFLLKVERDVEDPSHRAALFCSLGNLYYCKARLERQRIRQKAEVEAREEKLDMNLPVIRPGERDALDVTEIVAVGSSLKMSNPKILEVLEKAIDCWEKCIDSLAPNVLLTPTFSAMKGIGYLFRLYGYKELEATSWNQLFRVAKKLGSAKHQFLAAGELLAVLEAVDSSIISCVEALKFDKKCYACHVYKINLARNFLFQGKVEECRQVVNLINVQSLLYFFLANAQYKILLALVNLSQPSVGNLDNSPLVLTSTLFENLMYLIINNQWDTYNEATVVQLLVMETALLLCTTNAELNYVRPARCYLKCALPLSKKLALPAKVCQVMTLGCRVDLLTWNLTESEINAQEVESLLELGVLKVGNHETVSSPRRDSGLKIVPHFLSTKDCKCHCCLVTDYPVLALDALSNRVQLLVGNDGHREAQQVIQIGMRVADFIMERKQSAKTLSTTISSSVARFYYVVASTFTLWKKYEEALRYASVATHTLKSAPVKHVGFELSIKGLILGIRWTQNYKRPIKPKPVSRRLASNNCIASAVTPEIIASTKDATAALKSNVKRVEKGFYDVGEMDKSARKSLYKSEKNKRGCSADELEGISQLAISPVTTTSGKIETPKVYGTHLHVANSIKLAADSHKSNTPDSRVSDVPIFAQKLERPRRGQAKTNLFAKAIYNQLAGSSTPDQTDLTKAVLHTPPNPVIAEASSARKIRLDKQPNARKVNILGTPCMASLAKIGITAKTPAIRVYYDPDGLESTAKKPKSKSTVKKPKRLATKVDDKSGTPKAARARDKEKVILDDSNDEIELVSAQFKRLLAKKERNDEGTFKKPSIVGTNVHVDDAKPSNQLECSAKFSTVDKDDSGSSDSFHSTLTHFDESLPSLPSLNKPLATYSKKGNASSEATSAMIDDSLTTDSSFCSNETSLKKSARKKLNLPDAQHEKSSSTTALAENASGAGSPTQDRDDNVDTSAVFAAPYRKVINRAFKTIRPVFEETVEDLDDESGASFGKERTEEDDEDSPEVIVASTKSRKARRAIFEDTVCLPGAAADSTKRPQNLNRGGGESSALLKPRKPKRADTRETDSPDELVSPFRKVIGRSAFSKNVLDETSVDLTNETIEKISDGMSNGVETDLDTTTVAAPFRKILGTSGAVPKARRVIHDETMDEEEKMSKSTNHNLNDTFDVMKESKTTNAGGSKSKLLSKVTAKSAKLGQEAKQKVKLPRAANGPTSRAAGVNKASARPARGAKCGSKSTKDQDDDVSKRVPATKNVTSARVVSSAAARPKRGVRAAQEPAGSKPVANSAKSTLKVPSPNVRGRSPGPENVDPQSSSSSPNLIDSSVIESSFVEQPEMKLPLASRCLAEEMNKLTIQSANSSKLPRGTSDRATRRNVKK